MFIICYFSFWAYAYQTPNVHSMIGENTLHVLEFPIDFGVVTQISKQFLLTNVSHFKKKVSESAGLELHFQKSPT